MNKAEKEEREIIKYKKRLQAQQLLVGDDAESPTLFRKNKVGRNDPCPCGSGKKAKNCCGISQEYGYKRLVLRVTPERYMKHWRNEIPFVVGETVLASKAFPVESFRGKPCVITERGMEEHICNFYFKIEIDPALDPDGLVDTSIWYSDGHLVKPKDYKP